MLPACCRTGIVFAAFVCDPGLAVAQVPHSITALLDGAGFAAIPAGEFMMGSERGNDDERPRHRVRITRGFEMSKYEITQAQWNAVMGRAHGAARSGDPSSGVNPSHFRGASLPVENVNWQSVQKFIAALNTRDPDHSYRLPTESEWEYAARAGSAGEEPAAADAAGWCAAASQAKTHPVGQKAPNAWGLYDMTGNVSEWVQDWYAPEYPAGPESDPPGAPSGSYRVYRGGSWLSDAKHCRPAVRGFDLPANAQSSVGFRVVRTRR